MPKAIESRATGNTRAGEALGILNKFMGGKMEHLSEEQAINFVNQAMAHEELATAQKHLESDCKRCAQAVATWQTVRRSSLAEADYQPPAGVVRIMKAAFAAGLGNDHGGAKLLFDSILTPATAGIRSMSRDTRQLLYGVGPYLLDLYISARPGGKAISVTGQLMNSNFPEKLLNAVPIVVGNGTGTEVLARTNTFGEFQGELEYSGDLELRLPSTDGPDIIIRLGCLLSGLVNTGAESSKSAPKLPRD